MIHAKDISMRNDNLTGFPYWTWERMINHWPCSILRTCNDTTRHDPCPAHDGIHQNLATYKTPSQSVVQASCDPQPALLNNIHRVSEQWRRWPPWPGALFWSLKLVTGVQHYGRYADQVNHCWQHRETSDIKWTPLWRSQKEVSWCNHQTLNELH